MRFEHFVFALYVAFLFVVYIAVRYNCYLTVKNIGTLDKEITDLKMKSVKQKTIYQNTVSMQDLSKRLENRGVGISKEPVKDIIVIKNN